jgi:hypothetical protein
LTVLFPVFFFDQKSLEDNCDHHFAQINRIEMRLNFALIIALTEILSLLSSCERQRKGLEFGEEKVFRVQWIN